MNKQYKQEYSIKSVPTDEPVLLENTLNSMSNSGWELYSIYESEQNSRIVYNCIFVKESENFDDETDEDIVNFRSQVEKMLYTKDEPYELCVNMQRKIKEKKEKIEKVKKFLESSKENERELLNEEIKKDIDELNNLKKDLREILAPSKMSKFLGEEKLSINLSEENYSLCDPKNPSNLLSQTVKVRQNLTKELGYIIPKVQFIENSSLSEYEFTINIHGVSVVRAFAYPDYVAYFEDELGMDKPPKNSFKTKDPLTKRKIIWIKKEDCKNYWTEGLEASEYIANYLSYYSVVHVDEIFDYNDLNRYIDFVNNESPLITDAILGEYISVPELKYLLIQLIRERVSVKDIVYIFEKLNDFSDISSKVDLLARLRIALSRQISESVSDSDKEILAYELDEDTLDLLDKQTSRCEDSIRLDLSKFSKLKKMLKEAKKEIIGQNAILLVPQQYRQIVFILVSQLFMDVPVLCWEEILPEYKVNIAGVI